MYNVHYTVFVVSFKLDGGEGEEDKDGKETKTKRE